VWWGLDTLSNHKRLTTRQAVVTRPKLSDNVVTVARLHLTDDGNTIHSVIHSITGELISQLLNSNMWWTSGYLHKRSAYASNSGQKDIVVHSVELCVVSLKWTYVQYIRDCLSDPCVEGDCLYGEV